MDPLDRFSQATSSWFRASFHEPTPAQAGAWQAISSGQDALVVAPTGSGKTLAAFLWSLDRLASEPLPEEPLRRLRVLYISPLKALAFDVERNLRAPLAGIRGACQRLQLPEPDIRVGTRSGDTSAEERRGFARRPPDVLITTPESLFLLLTSQAREALRGIDTVIVDEVHAVAATKRGAHLAVSLERLDELLDQPAQRIGLSATVRPIEEVARFLGGQREVAVVQPPAAKTFDLQVVVPVEDMGALGEGTGAPAPGASAAAAEARTSIWPAVESRVLDLVETHRSTIVFANSRRLAERLTSRLNEIATERAHGDDEATELVDLADYDAGPPRPAGSSGVKPGGLGQPRRPPAQVMAQAGSGRGGGSGYPASPSRELAGRGGTAELTEDGFVEVARAHHGSVSREQRLVTEELLKSGRLPAVVATSSLELGIDMGAVDLVVQVESPPSVASGLQRVGRAGHQVGAVSQGVIFPKFRGDLVQCAVVAERMVAGQIEAMAYPRNPLDVLAQHIVAMVAMDEWDVEELGAVLRRAAPFSTLPASALEATLDMLSGRYPSDDFAELRPRLIWDRVAGTVTGRPGAQRLAVTSGGTIPDRGLFGVFLAGDSGPGKRVGELDEEMVYESRVGDIFLLGSTSWRIEDISHDRVLVSPAPGQLGKMPFWHGDALGRPLELGRALGAYQRELSRLPDEAAVARAAAGGLDTWAAQNLVGYLREQREATGVVPDDRTLLVERFRDELGDWRLAIHSPFGGQVNGPWALMIAARLRERHGVDVQAMHSDDGIVCRIPMGYDGDDEAEAPRADLAVFEPDEVDPLVQQEVGGSALFASRFRECAARALLLPKRNPGRRSPLWQQRQKSAQLLEVASQFGSFPVILETMREVLQDVFDVPGLVQLMRDIAARQVSIVEVETREPSPFARSLLFGYVGAFMYEGDAPLAERRAAALSLDTGLLAELLGQAELRELIDPVALAEVESEIGLYAETRRATDVEGVADLLRRLGDLSTSEAIERGATPQWLADLEESRRAIRVRMAGEERWLAVEDAGRVRDGLGVPLPVGVPEAFLEPVRDPLGDLVSRWARTHGPFVASQVARRFSLGVAVVEAQLARMSSGGRLVRGEFRPGGVDVEWCDAEVLRMVRRRSLAKLRQEVEPVPPVALGRFLPQWQHLGPQSGRGVDGLLRVIEQLQGAAVPASALETLVLPARVTDYSPAMLDELTSSGEVLWAGAGSLPGNDGWVTLVLADSAELLLSPRDSDLVGAATAHERMVGALEGGAALFFRALSDRATSLDDAALVTALWELVWGGWLTNDTLAPLRALVGTGRTTHSSKRAPARARPGRSAYGRPGRDGRPVMPSRSGPPTAAGRWSLLPEREADPTRRAAALAEVLLDRYGVVTRGSAVAERAPGGWAAVYRVLSGFEDSGRARRGYFVEGLGGAQFATPGAVDRMRALAAVPVPSEDGAAGSAPAFPGQDGADSAGYSQAAYDSPWAVPVPGGWPASRARQRQRRDDARAVVLAATDPANPYGAALAWPDHEGSHRPARKAGALVVVVDGHCVLYVERGGKTLLSFDDDPHRLGPATDALALAVRDGALGKLSVERADGEAVLTSPLGLALEAAGFRPTPRGLRLRA